MKSEAAPEAKKNEDGKRREKQHGHPDGVSADAGRAAQIPRAANDDDSQRPEVIARGRGERGAEFAQVEHEDGRVERHVENAGREREPAFLVAPEWPEGAPHPDVKAAFIRNGGGEFADHERGGQAPDDGQNQQDDDSPAKARAAENVLHAVRTTGHHEECGGNQGQKKQFFGGGAEQGTHTDECNWECRKGKARQMRVPV